MKIGICDLNGWEIELGNEVEIINGQLGTVVYECGAFGVAIQDFIDYESIQDCMDEDDWCCGNEYSGCRNDNFISIWELYWNSNSEENVCRFIRVLKEGK